MGSVEVVDAQSLSVPSKTILTGVTFGLSLPLVQYAGKICRISSATPFIGSAFGMISVALCSTASVVVVDRLCISSGVQTDDNSLEVLHLLVPAAVGLISFKTLGGKCCNLLPSDVRHPGVYAKAYLPSSGGRYASPSQKFVIRSLLKQFGCHHCGRTTGQSVADHMPPNALVPWKVKRHKVTQKYYPQCVGCMRVQSLALRHGWNHLILHRKSGWPEPYVFSGFLMAALQPDSDLVDDYRHRILSGLTELHKDKVQRKD